MAYLVEDLYLYRLKSKNIWLKVKYISKHINCSFFITFVF